jgi:hypothetical protein
MAEYWKSTVSSKELGVLLVPTDGLEAQVLVQALQSLYSRHPVRKKSA